MNLPDENQEWRKSGKCVDLPLPVADKLFFFGSGGSPKRAQVFCSNCPVKRECLHYAILHDQDGVWAGTIKDERILFKGLMLERILAEGLVTQERFASPEPERKLVQVDPEADEEYPLELLAESYFPIADVAV